jgi:hypothetical protein
MSEVKVKKPSAEELKTLGIENWTPWECKPSTFDWEYDCNETFYVKEGKVTVKHVGGQVSFGKGDLVTFPKGMKCVWNVKETIRKVYKMH